MATKPPARPPAPPPPPRPQPSRPQVPPPGHGRIDVNKDHSIDLVQPRRSTPNPDKGGGSQGS